MPSTETDRVRPVLSGRAALITGGASGIGRAIAALFARAGAAVAVVDRDEAGGSAAARAIADVPGGRAIFVRADVTRDADCGAAVDKTLAAFGRLDVLVNNAGVIRRAAVPDTSDEDWDRTLAVNVKAVYLMCRRVIPIMVRAGCGAIVNTASNWGLAGGAKAAAYCASKGAVVLLTKAMAIDHGRQKIRVNCVCPGDVDTPMLRGEAAQLGEPVEAFLAESAANPLGRVARPEDVARAALYLASDESSFVTGAALVVDGGFSAG